MACPENLKSDKPCAGALGRPSGSGVLPTLQQGAYSLGERERQIHIHIAETSGESASTVIRKKPPSLFKVADGAG